MAIRIVRNESGNCINFYGATNPTYWNSCLSGEVDAVRTDTVNVINDIITAETGVVKYEFYQIEYTELTDAEGNGFASAQAAADYITEKANVTGVASDISLIGQQVDFKLDDTSTSIMFNNGYSYGVNTIKAVPNADGTIHIMSNFSNSHHDDLTFFTQLEHTNVFVDGAQVSGGLNDVVNVLNELFTVGPFQQVVISDPFSTMIADVAGEAAGYTLVGNTAVDPVGDDLATNSTSGNYAGVLSTATIDQAGEYFTFDIRGEGQIGFGLVHSQASYDADNFSGNSLYADPARFAVSNSAHYGFQFSHWFHPTPNGSWTNYGANTSYVMGPAWYSSNTQFEGRDEWLAGTNIKIKVGLDENGYIAISSLADDGVTWKLHARTSYPAPQGAEFRLGVKFANSSPRLYSAPKVHLLEPAAPVMNFRYIESPDGVFQYPLFATEEEANYYDQTHTIGTVGTGTSHTHTFADDPTNTTWYMADTGSTMTDTSDPTGTTFQGQVINYTEITSLTNADLTPAAFTGSNITQQEGTNVNIQLSPQDVTYTTSATISPAGSGLVFTNGYLLSGTLADVGADTTYTVTVTRANSYGSSVGSFTITATDVAPVQTNDTPWNKALDFSGGSERAQMVSTASYYNPLMMRGLSTTVPAPTTAGNTSASTNSAAWATAVVFRKDGHNSNQHIWNAGEGSSGDNIYLRLSSNGQLYFGWGRDGAGVNECAIGGIQSNRWYGVYIAHNGTRLNGSNATAANLAAAFDIRITNEAIGWVAPTYNYSISANWTAGSTGYRMDRATLGSLTVGGRGSNRSFHGKVASMVVTTLRRDVAMPTDAEVAEMIVDPIGWLNDYKVGAPFRKASSAYDSGSMFAKDANGIQGTQIWLMGDGTNDSYSNMIRNQVMPSDQNATKLNMISMVSNDIQTVNIAGLT